MHLLVLEEEGLYINNYSDEINKFRNYFLPVVYLNLIK